MISRKMRRAANRLIIGLAKVIGMKFIDQETKEPLGKAIVIPFRGKIHLIGYHAPKGTEEAFLIPKFDIQKRATYWNQSISFHKHPSPDFPNESSQRNPNTSTPPGGC